jgi:hypothetical protein
VYGIDERNKHVVTYDEGVTIDHILASGTFPNFFDYPKFKVRDSDFKYKEKEHIFWDGGFRSNTPLREVIHAHRDFWHTKDSEKEDDVPDLEVYADLWPSELKEEPISFDLDFVENRKLNIIFADKTHYDEQVAEVVSDYIDLVKKLKNLAERKGASENEIRYILKEHAESKNRGGNIRMYRSLLEGRFRLTKVVRIDHTDDGNEVANKIYDYSHASIEKLMKDGYCDALNEFGIQSIKDGIIRIAYKNGTVNNDGIDVQGLEQKLQQLHKTTKRDNGYDDTINIVETFIDEVKSIPDRVDNLEMGEEKVLLIQSAKQFQGMIMRTKKSFPATTESIIVEKY